MKSSKGILWLCILICLIGGCLFGAYIYLSGKAKIPFSSQEVIGKEVDDVISTLEKAGFSQIKTEEITDGWSKGNIVLGMLVDNKEFFNTTDRIDKDCEILVQYSSNDRVDVSAILDGWQGKNYEDVYSQLKSSGFTDIQLTETITEDIEKDRKIANITLNEIEFTEGECYLPVNSRINISYYSLRIRIGNSDLPGRDCTALVSDLKDRGFTNIWTKKVTDGWAEANSVVKVSIDGEEQYDPDEQLVPDTKIVIYYSSTDRIDVTDILSSWQTLDYEDLEKLLSDQGFNHIRLKEISTSDKERDRAVSWLRIYDKLYTSGSCSLPKNASIEISYFAYKINIGKDNTDYKGQDYEDVISDLQDKGFINLWTREVKTGWKKGNSVIDVSVNGDKSFGPSDGFAPDAKILIRYSSDNRIDITDLLENWKEQEYTVLMENLKEAGFSNIQLSETETEEISQNHKISSILLFNKPYKAGGCYLPLDAQIGIEYYKLYITFDSDAKSMRNAGQYTKYLDQLKAKGFTNIRVKRANDIGFFWTGKTPGEIKSITINGNSNIKAGDKFSYDSEIVIVVHTHKTGFDEILEIDG